MKRCPWFGAALLLMVGGVVVLTLRVSPLHAQDSERQVEATPKQTANPLVQATPPRVAALAPTHRVSFGRVELPGDTHVTSPITYGIPNAGAPETGAARRRAADPVYQNITLGGSLSAQHNMIEVLKGHLGQIHELTINILSNRGDAMQEIVAQASMVEVSLDLEARTWELTFVLHSEE